MSLFDDSQKGLELLPTHVWLSAAMRQSNRNGVMVVLVRRGDADRGTVVVRVDQRDGLFRLYTRAYTMDDGVDWVSALDGAAVSQDKADAYIERSIARDPDLWVVDADDPTGANPFV